jgi:hypothetical protein
VEDSHLVAFVAEQHDASLSELRLQTGLKQFLAKSLRRYLALAW